MDVRKWGLVAGLWVGLWGSAALADSTPLFTEVTAESGLSGVQCSVLALVDYDGDGYLDLLMDGQRLFRNVPAAGGKRAFAEVAAGLSGPAVSGVFGDCDGDGDLDLFINGGPGGRSRLMLNNGRGYFVESDQSPQFFAGEIITGYRTSVAATWGDYNGDGLPDLAVGGWGDFESGQCGRDRLWKNTGGCRFVEVPLGGEADTVGCSRSASFLHYNWDQDRRIDLAFVREAAQGNRLWENAGGDAFYEVPEFRGDYGTDSSGGRGQGMEAVDLHGNGRGDSCFVANQWLESWFHTDWGYDNSRLLDRAGASPDYPYVDLSTASSPWIPNTAASSGYDEFSLWTCPVFFDYDGDGDDDLYLTSAGAPRDPGPSAKPAVDYRGTLLQRSGANDGTVNYSALSAVPTWYGLGAVAGDYNRDGRPDLFICGKSAFSGVVPPNPGLPPPQSLLAYRNDTGSGNSWLIVDPAMISKNHTVKGMTVVVEANGKSWRKTLGRTGYMGTQGAEPLFFGLGPAVNSANVRLLPSDPAQSEMLYTGVAARQVFRPLYEGNLTILKGNCRGYPSGYDSTAQFPYADKDANAASDGKSYCYQVLEPSAVDPITIGVKIVDGRVVILRRGGGFGLYKGAAADSVSELFRSDWRGERVLDCDGRKPLFYDWKGVSATLRLSKEDNGCVAIWAEPQPAP